MPWRPLPRIAFAVAIYPFQPSSAADLPLELGDELYIIEQGGVNGEWCRGYLVAPPSLLAGLTSTKGQTLEARVFSGIFPRNCVEIREVLGEGDNQPNGQKPLTNGERRSIISVTTAATDGTIATASRANGVEEDRRSSVAISQTECEVSDVVIARKGKPSQIFIHKPDSDIGKASPMPITPATPVTAIATQDPSAPKPPAPVPMLKIGDDTPTSLSEPLVDEIASCLREWHSTNLHELLLSRQYNVLEDLSHIVQELDLARRQLLHDVLTAREKDQLRDEAVWKLVRANKMLSGEVIVRDPMQRGRLLTGDDSAIHLTKLQSEMSMLDSQPTTQSDTSSLHHLLLDVNAVSGYTSGPVTLAIHLCTKSDSGHLMPLSETYILDIPSPEKFANLGQSSKLKTLFTDFNAKDIGAGSSGDAQIYLVVTVRAPEAISANVRPRSRSSTASSSASKPGPNSHQPVKGSLKTRRSVLWGPKSRGQQSFEKTHVNSRSPPKSSGSSFNSEGPTDSQPPKVISSIRSVGVGILEVSQILRQNKDTEQVVNLWTPAQAGEEGDSTVDGFQSLVHTLLPSPDGKYVRLHQASRLHLHLYPFISSDSDTLVRDNPTILHHVIKTRRIGFAEAPTKPRSDIYVTLSQALFPPGALLSHPHTGQVPVPMTLGLQNLQLTLEVRTAAGTRIDNCIFPSSDNIAHTAWRTTVAERGTPWKETIRLQIDRDLVPLSHLVMSVADAPEFPFAIAWMPLWDQHAFMRDGTHSLMLHAYDKHTSSIENGKGAYLSLPWSALGKNEFAKDEAVTGPMASLRLETYLCSTEYSQDQVILSLLNWKERPAGEVIETLKRIVFVPEIEIVKQLSGVFDALFGILVDNAGNEEHEDLIFNDLVTVLGIVHDRRFNLGPLVDHYAEKQFYFPFVTPCLIRSYLRLLQAATDVRQARNLRAAFKVGRHLLKFIINGRQQQKAKEEGIGITKVQSTFNGDLHTMFKSLQALMRDPSPALVGSKTLVVQHFHTWLPELSKALSKDEVVMIALSFIDSCKDVKGMLILYTMVLIQHYTQLDIFATGSERQGLISSCVGWLAPYWGATGGVSDQYRDQVRLCSAIVSQLLEEPDPLLYEFMPKIVSSYCSIVTEGVEDTEYLSLLFSKSFPFQVKASKTKQKFDEALVELSAIMAAISKIPNTKIPVMKELDLATFIFQALEAHNSILNCEAYPQGWLSLHIYNHRATLKSLERLSSVLVDRFLPSPDDADSFDTKLWEMFFMTLLKVVSSDTLALETFPEQKRRAVWKIGGDVREQGADLLRSTWEAIGWEASEEQFLQYGLKKLGGYQVQYVPALVAPIIELCLSVHEGLRHVAVEVLRTMMLSEWDLNQDLSIIETELISSLDNLFKTKHVNDSVIQKLFITELLDHFEGYSEVDGELYDAVKSLVATIDELLDLLVASYSGSMTDSVHTMRLMQYMKDMGRQDIFIRYVHELAEVQAATGNFTEAGLALQFHADLYDWDITKPVPLLLNPSFPEQNSFERKESLYFAIIQHFENGKAWAHALACYKELAEHYENTSMDFSKLARTQSSMAKIYESIVKEEKEFPRYFRVVYKGLGFPATLQDKQFIFEGAPHERMATFIDRMQRIHPAAQIMSSGEIQDFEGQFLQISAVNVHRDISHPVYQRSKIPHSVREHLLLSNPCLFSVTSKRHKGGTDVNELYVEKTVFRTAEAFPNILRRSEIVAVDEVALSPLQSAVERIWRKTQELVHQEKRTAAGEDPGLKSLTEMLEQLLERKASLFGCMAVYRQFLEDTPVKEKAIDTETDEKEDEEREADQEVQEPMDPMKNALAVALIDHALTIKHALSLSLYHRPAYQATQSELMRHFEEIFALELKSIAPVNQDLSHTFQHQTMNSLDTRQTYSAPRSVSPEQELMRRSSRVSSALDKAGKRSVGQRISIMNPFKRSNHATQGSTNTIQALPGIARLQGSERLNGNTTPVERVHMTSTASKIEDNGSVREEDDIATVHSRATNHSRTDTHSKRRSWFGGDRSHKASSSISLAAAATTASTEDSHSVAHKTRPSRSDSRQTQTKSDGRSRSEPQRASAAGRDGDMKNSCNHNEPKPSGASLHGGWSAIPSVKDYPRPSTALSTTAASLKGSLSVSGASVHGDYHAPVPSPLHNPFTPPAVTTGHSKRESVLKRFSLLKGVGRKGSRLDFRGGMTVHEE